MNYVFHKQPVEIAKEIHYKISEYHKYLLFKKSETRKATTFFHYYSQGREDYKRIAQVKLSVLRNNEFSQEGFVCSTYLSERAIKKLKKFILEIQGHLKKGNYEILL